jgi:uncharacterized protein
MDILELMRLNLLSPMVLAFALGLIAVWVGSDLRLPEDLYSILSIYLLFSIGLKGGAELSITPFSSIILPILMTLAIGIITPLIAFFVLRQRFDQINAAAIAAHYGSVSAVTFTAALTFAQAQYPNVEGFLPALVAVLEVPGIAIAILLAKNTKKATPHSNLWHELLTGRSLFILLGGLVIGFLAGKPGLEQVKPFFIDPFKGVLTLFLLEMGMVAGHRFGDLKKQGAYLIGFGILVPLLHGAIGIALARVAGMSQGGAFVLGVMAASASYIAAPAAVRVALPQANPAYYLGASLGITFPFNLTLGIPIYALLTGFIYSL